VRDTQQIFWLATTGALDLHLCCRIIGAPEGLSSRRDVFERYIGCTLFIGLGLTAAFAGNQKK
jgi:hypothetical protein